MSGFYGGTPPGAQPLFIRRAADMQLTTDQVFTKQGAFTTYKITRVVARRVSGGTSVTCAGGILSLTTGSTAAATADIFIYGDILD